MSVPLAVEGMDALALAQEGERLCRENNMKAGIKYLEMALEKKVNLGGRSIETVSAIYSQLGNAYFALRDFNKALEYHQYDLETAKLLNDQSGLAKANGNVANTYKALGDFDSAYDHAVVHLKLAREMNDKESEARALYNMGSIYHCSAKARIRSAAHRDISALSLSVPSDRSTTSELQAAINCYLQNLQIVEETEDLAACGRTYGNIGNTYYMLGDYVTAVEYHNKRLEIARQFGDRAAMKRAYTNLGNAHIFLSLPAKAIEYYRLALSMATELGDEVSEAQCCFSLGSGAAISGDFSTATEFHRRHLILARKLGDRSGEARACTALAEDCAALGETRKALYFYVLHAQIAAEMGDHLGESSARLSIDELLRGLDERKSSTLGERRISDVLDSSADPSPRPLTHLSASMQSLLLGEHNDCGLSRRAISTSTSSIGEAQRSLVNLEDDFIDMLSRMQSKRINDQRCDPIILSDLTNRSKGVTRQSDTVVCGAHSVGHTRRSNRLSAIFGRVGKAARHTFLLPSSSFLPVSTSTPRLSVTKSAGDQRPSSAFSRPLGTPLFDHSISTVSEAGAEGEVRSRTESEIPAETQLDGGKPSSPYSVTSESPLFRVPKVPPRNRARAAHVKSQSTLTDLRCRAVVDKRNGAEDMLDLIESLQGRRMEEQRAHLNVNAESVSVSGINPEEPKESNGDRKTERSRSEDAHSLYEMLIRSQGDRLEEQRSELPSTIPDEDISQIVLTMQKGRIEAQRAHLKPPDEECATHAAKASRSQVEYPQMAFQLASLVDAIRAIYDPNTNNERRIAASQLIESAKETNEAQSLADELISQNDLLIAHVGWNFVEHVIKFKWLELDANARISVRNGCFTQMASAQMAHAELRNAAARCIVAMIEHEWPQNWPELLEQLDQVASVSTIHAQLPFIILQRLIENVVTMGIVENVARRKELNNAIAVQLPLIINTTNNTLERCLNHSDDEWMLLARCALSLIGEVVGWASAKILESQLGVLLRSICAYLNKPQFSLYEYAARCLWRIASRRRAKNDENTIVLALFDDIPMRSMLTSANEAATVGVENVEHYRFLKALCDVLSALGIHLSDVWQRAPPNFEMYLSAIDAFLHHPSMYLRNEAASVLVSFISHTEIREDPLFNELISRVIIALPHLIEKIGLPSENGSSHSYYSQIDYDDDTQFMHDFIQFRDRCMRIVRGACVERHMGSLCKIVEEWIQTRCIASPQSVSEIEWEAMQRYSRMVLSTCYEEGLLSEQHLQTFTELFDGVLFQVANSTNAVLINRLLSVLSSLFIVLASHPDRLSPFLLQIRRLLTEVADDSSEDKSVRRHCISVLLRLITTFSDAIKSEAESILDVCISVRGRLSAMQQAACAHVLAALSNLCVDFQTQSTFLAATMQNCIAYFHSSEVTTAMRSDSEFLSYIGFTLQAPLNSEEAQNSSFVSNRRALRSNLSTMEGVLTQVRSVQPPAHPAFEIIRPILPTLFLLADRLKSLYEVECVQLIHPSYGPTVVDITESDRQQLISAVDPLAPCSARIVTDDPRSHARCFISDITDSVQTITGLLASKMASELFMESSMESWSLQLVSYISSTPDFRLRFWIRRSWRFVLCSCPELAYSKVREMLQRILSEMHLRLTTRWEQLAHIEITEEPSLDQLFTEHMACMLTREFVGLLRAIINISDATSSNPDERKEGITCFITPEISRDKCTIDAVIALSFFFLTCRDATSAIRIIPVCRAVVDLVKNMSNDQCEESVAVFMMVRSIQSLQVHGSDEIALGPLLSLIFHVYYSLRKCCVSLLRVLQQVPQCTEETLQSFDSRIISMITNNELVVEKVRREIVKKLLRPLIAMSVGQQHKRPMHLRSLPPLAKRAKPLVEEDFTALALIFNTD